MNEQIREVKITMEDGTTKRISVDENGMILVLCGSGPYSGAFRVKLEDATQAELAAAKEVEGTTPDTETEDATADEYKVGFDEAVALLAYMRGEKFLELVRYARGHENSFAGAAGYPQLERIVNADDCYCTAIIKLTRRLGDAVERRAFKLFEAAVDGHEKEDFLDLFGALQIINSLC